MTAQNKRRRSSGHLESEILAALWAADHPLSPSETVAAIGGDVAYPTVQTVLTRLVAKGAVRRELTGRACAYSPVLDQAAVVASRMRAVLDSSTDDHTVLTRFVGTLCGAGVMANSHDQAPVIGAWCPSKK